MNKMKALFLTAVGQTEIREVEKPIPTPGELLLRIGRVGFCGGDLNGFKGLFELQEYPNILGHEVGATIEELTAGVPEYFQIGQQVTIYPYLNCGQCVSCRKGRRNACQDNKTMGVRRPGAMTRYISIPWQDVFISHTLSLRELALVEPLTVGFHAVARGRVSQQDTVAVIGCGIVGMGALASAVHRGAQVIAIDLDDTKLEIAKQIGVNYTINSSKEDMQEALQRITQGDGPDVIIEAVGSHITYRAAVEAVAYTGRVVCIGYAKKPVEFNTGVFVRKEIEILGSRNCTDEFPEVISYLEAGKFPVEAVISREVNIDQAGQALADWAEDAHGIVKIMVNFGD
ncbi:zinc-binding alcohol dehydrogenase family protein [Aquirufa rosea]|uniref:Zinc-binding alcohol dehydrogenase family protein n=1 Tax=Aquirufa rosea TaxID=2509241 RepID=A0A4Q1BX99_9BACT|nr:zinc-binding alcohol dehydrogenase family protein [Aquirufa rosea]RXK46570.1 zinc-binding alcohol dehydrogenase family protein [Aquirufa rosea]